MKKDNYHTSIYRAALADLHRNVALTSEEWADIPRILKDCLPDIVAQESDPEKAVTALVGKIRQLEQIRRSERRRYAQV